MRRKCGLLLMGSLLVGCSASSGGIASMSEADQTIVSTENETEATNTEETTSEEIGETIAVTEENGAITELKILSFRSDFYGSQEGWYGQVLADQLGLRLNILSPVVEENLNKADVIIWPFATELFYEWAANEKLYVWDDVLLENTRILNTELKTVLEYDAALTDGVLYGITGDVLYDENGNIDFENYTPEYHSLFTISAQSEHVKEAIQLIDWMASAEGKLTYWYGPKGVGWDRDDEGTYYLTELGHQIDDFTVLPGYGVFHDGFSLVTDQIWANMAQIYDSPSKQIYFLNMDNID